MFYLSARKRDGRAARHLCDKLVVVASDKWLKNHHHFLPSYLTVKLRGSVNTPPLQYKLSGCLWHPNYGMGLLSRKKDKIADGSPTRRWVSHSLFSWGRFLLEGDGYFRSSGKQIWKSIWNTESLRGVIGPISTANDYLNAAFDVVISLCGSCRNCTLIL